jgi:hypothetical protein
VNFNTLATAALIHALLVLHKPIPIDVALVTPGGFARQSAIGIDCTRWLTSGRAAISRLSRPRRSCISPVLAPTGVREHRE